MHHERLAPCAALEPFIAHHWTVEWDLRGEPPFTAETLPHPCVHLLFERGDAQVAGVPTRKFARRLSGKDRVFAIKFRPAAFQPWLAAPLWNLTDRVVKLEDVFGAAARPLRDAILAEPDVDACAHLAEEFLCARIPPMPPEIARMRDLVEQMAVDTRITRVEDAAVLAGVELRTFQRRFKNAVGVPAKWVIQRYRLHEAAARMTSENPPDMATLALELGYFDQSHFIRDFKSVVGSSPGEYVARARA